MQVVSCRGGTTVSMPLGRSTLQMVENVSWPGRLPESAPTSPGGRIAQGGDADATPRLASTCSASRGGFQRNCRRAQGTAEAASRLPLCPAPEGGARAETPDGDGELRQWWLQVWRDRCPHEPLQQSQSGAGSSPPLCPMHR